MLCVLIVISIQKSQLQTQGIMLRRFDSNLRFGLTVFNEITYYKKLE